MSSTPPAARSTPPASRPATIHGRAGSVAPTSARTVRPGAASRFITTTIQSPSRAVQVSVCLPGPETCAAQLMACCGAAGVAVPGWLLVAPLLPSRPVTVVYGTPDRYRMAAGAGAIPRNTALAVPGSVTRMRTLPSTWPTQFPLPVCRRIDFVASAYPWVEYVVVAEVR